MSTTEALRTLVDKLQHEVNELRAENVKLKANQTGEESSNESELEELRQRLHQVEEKELDAGQRIAELEEQYATATVDNLREELEGRVGESQELRNQLDEYVNKISTLTEMSDLACYRAVDRERQKWEARENQLLELLRSRARSDEVPQVEITSALANSSTVVDTLTSEPMARVAELPSGSGKGDPPSHVTTDITCGQDELSDIPTTLNAAAQLFQSRALTNSLVNEGFLQVYQ